MSRSRPSTVGWAKASPDTFCPRSPMSPSSLWRSLATALALASTAALAAPTIQWFAATPSSVATGANTTLRWQVDGATSVTIDNGIGTVAAKGTRVVTPGTTTTYTITAQDGGGQTTQHSRTVIVSPNPTEV